MKVLLGFLGVLIMAMILAILMALPVMWLWNYLMPELFGLATIHFWQALAMSMLSSILFKGSSSSSKD